MTDHPIEKIIFFGFSTIVSGTVRALAQVGAAAPGVAIVADPIQAARPMGRGLDLDDLAAVDGVDTLVVERVDDPAVLDLLGDMTDTIALSVGAPWFFTDDMIRGPLANRILNLHGTRLPADRGGAIFSWMILRGQRTGLCLLHRLNQRIDAGEVIRYDEFIYPPELRKPGQMMAHYDERNIEFLRRFILDIVDQGLPLAVDAVVPDYLSSYWPRLDARSNGWIDWRLEAVDLERFVCAFDEPYGGARTRFHSPASGDIEVVLRDVYSQSVDGATHPYQWGIVYRKSPGWVTVAANGGELLVCSITDSDGNDLRPSLRVGDRLFTPQARLEEALLRPTRDQQIARRP